MAFYLLLTALGEGRRTILYLRNDRLVSCLRQILNVACPGAGDLVKFYPMLRQQGRSFGTASTLDLVIGDEAQRIQQAEIPLALAGGRVRVFFGDDSQMLLPAEGGSAGNFEAAAIHLGLPVVQRRLAGVYRCRGGTAYHEWLETLLSAPDTIGLITRTWETLYELKVFDRFDQMIDVLRQQRERGHKVGLLAAFTEVNGRNGRTLRVQEPPIHWLMDPHTEYVPFWIGGQCNELTRCASIYGSQGFELDYADLVWGRDMVLDSEGESWTLADPTACEDDVDRPSLKSMVQRGLAGDLDARETALRLFRNRYRILLTRGILGTYVYCEDEATARFLKSLTEGHTAGVGVVQTSELR